MDGTPLSYIIRDNDNPDVSALFDNYNEQCIGCAPLHGVSYEADISTVHQSIVSFTTGYPSEDWVKPTEKYKDGRKCMNTLRDHISGEGNTSRMMAEAER